MGGKGEGEHSKACAAVKSVGPFKWERRGDGAHLGWQIAPHCLLVLHCSSPSRRAGYEKCLTDQPFSGT